MVCLILFILLATLSLLECHYWDHYGHHYGYGHGHHQFWHPNSRVFGHANRHSRPQWNTKIYFEDSSEEVLPQRSYNQRKNLPEQNVGANQYSHPQWNTKTYFEDSSEEVLPQRSYNQRKNLPEQNVGTYFNYENKPEQNEPSDSLQTLVDQVIEIDKKIKSICNRGHNPSEDITEEYYKRMFNIEGYKLETATVKIKHTVLYTCLDPVLRGHPCLEDIALLPENLNIEEAVYSIEDYNLVVKIPFKSNSVFMRSDVCRVGDINEREIIVSKNPTIKSYYRHMERNAFKKKDNTDVSIAFRELNFK